MSRRLPRELHPVAWWCWALGLAAGASLSANPAWMLLLAGVAAVVVGARRSDQPWARAFRLYCLLGLVIVVIRVLFRILLGGGYGTTVLIDLPEIPLPDWVLGIRLLGPVTAESVLSGLYDGLRLAAIVVCIGAANALANPKRLLKSLPPALHEVGSALVVSVSVLPQLAESVVRVRDAQRLRGGPEGKVRGLRRILVPVLEDAFERSVALAAGMDTRGYGRSGDATRRERQVTGALMLVGLMGVCAGAYGLLDQADSMPRWLVGPMLYGGTGVAVLGLVSAGARVPRTRYRPIAWRWPELAVAGCGAGVAATAYVVAELQPTIAFPALDVLPTISLLGLGGVLIGVLPAVLAPPAPLAAVPTVVPVSDAASQEVSRA